MQTVEQKFKGYLDCAQRGEISYDVVYGAGIKLGIAEAEVECLVKISSDKRRTSLISDDDEDEDSLVIKEIVVED